MLAIKEIINLITCESLSYKKEQINCYPKLCEKQTMAQWLVIFQKLACQFIFILNLLSGNKISRRGIRSREISAEKNI